jgi:quercetin dioxygenase-like cupin family protein
LKPNIETLIEIATYHPENHSSTTNRRLVSRSDCPDFEMVHGTIKPGGVAARHAHDDAYQAMYVLGGMAEISLGDQPPEEIATGAIVRIPPRLTHEVKSLGPDDLELLIVYSPPISR